MAALKERPAARCDQLISAAVQARVACVRRRLTGWLIGAARCGCGCEGGGAGAGGGGREGGEGGMGGAGGCVSVSGCGGCALV